MLENNDTIMRIITIKAVQYFQDVHDLVYQICNFRPNFVELR